MPNEQGPMTKEGPKGRMSQCWRRAALNGVLSFGRWRLEIPWSLAGLVLGHCQGGSGMPNEHGPMTKEGPMWPMAQSPMPGRLETFRWKMLGGAIEPFQEMHFSLGRHEAQ